MKSDEIRQLNDVAQEKALECISIGTHEACLRSLELSLLAELTAQMAEANEHLKRLAYPMQVVGKDGRIEDFTPTLRDQFAMASMAGMLSEVEGTAELSYKIADRMIEARKK